MNHESKKSDCGCKHSQELEKPTLYGPNGEDLVWEALRKDAAKGITS